MTLAGPPHTLAPAIAREPAKAAASERPFVRPNRDSISRMRDRERMGGGENVDGAQQDQVAQVVAALPLTFVSVIGQASPDVVGTLLHTHPQLAAPILAAVQHIRGNAFAQLAIATASTHSLPRPAPPAVEQSEPIKPAQNPHPLSSPTNRAAPTVDPDRAKHIERGKTAAWEQLARGTPDERSTPENIRLPPNIVQALEKAWQDTLKSKVAYEQGGNLVRNYGGSYELRRQSNDNPHMFEQDDNDIGRLQTLVAQVHTHPYREEKAQVPEQFASFSDGDFNSLMRSDAHLSILRSGPYTFILAKTKQFNAMVDRLNNDEAKLSAFAARMTAAYDKAAAATQGSFSVKVEAGVMAVCEQFHLVYYEGQGGDLTRKTKRPGP